MTALFMLPVNEHEGRRVLGLPCIADSCGRQELGVKNRPSSCDQAGAGRSKGACGGRPKPTQYNGAILGPE